MTLTETPIPVPPPLLLSAGSSVSSVAAAAAAAVVVEGLPSFHPRLLAMSKYRCSASEGRPS